MTLTDCHTCGCSEVICREAPERGFTKCCPDCRHTPRMTARDDLAVLLCSAVSHGQGKDVRWIPCEAHVWQADAVIREWLPGVIRELPTALDEPHVCNEVCDKIVAALRGDA